MKKIIFFSKDLSIGGMEKALVVLINSLCNNYEITLVLEEKKGILLKSVDPKIKIKEYKLSTSKNIILRKIHNYFKRFFWRFNNAKKYDFSCNYATYSVIGSRLSQIASDNSIYYVHSDYYNVFKKDINKIKSFFKEHHLEKFRKIVFVANESKNNFLKIYPEYKEKCEVINNLIDYNKIKKQSHEKIDFKIDKNKINFIFIGRLDNSSKNIELLLKSFNLAYQKNKNIKLYILGNGPYLNSILDFINKTNNQKNIVVIKETTNPYAYLQKCDVLILTSNYEGFPVVYLEALVLNKKIMTTVLTSDDTINIKDYAIKLEPKEEKIAEKMASISKKTINYNIDFSKINKEKINKTIELIEVKEKCKK